MENDRLEADFLLSPHAFGSNKLQKRQKQADDLAFVPALEQLLKRIDPPSRSR